MAGGVGAALSSSLASTSVAIASHAARFRCQAASISFIAARCCSRFADFTASRSRIDACLRWTPKMRQLAKVEPCP